MVDFMAYLAARPGTCLWIADTEYTARLLAGGAPPWLDVASLIAWRQQAQTLLRPSVTVLDVGALVEAWLGYRADLRQTAVAKRGPAAALGLPWKNWSNSEESPAGHENWRNLWDVSVLHRSRSSRSCVKWM